MKLKLFKILLYPIYCLCVIVVFSYFVIKYKVIPYSKNWCIRQKLYIEDFLRDLEKDR